VIFRSSTGLLFSLGSVAAFLGRATIPVAAHQARPEPYEVLEYPVAQAVFGAAIRSVGVFLDAHSKYDMHLGAPEHQINLQQPGHPG
jgi:hypothetical protein